MSPEEVCVGVKVRVRDRYRIEERRGMVGTVVGRYGGEHYVAVDVCFPDGQCRLFWPDNLEATPLLGLLPGGARCWVGAAQSEYGRT